MNQRFSCILDLFSRFFLLWFLADDNSFGTFEKMQQMLRYNPTERLSAKAALDHPYFDSLDKSQFSFGVLKLMAQIYCHHHLGVLCCVLKRDLFLLHNKIKSLFVQLKRMQMFLARVRFFFKWPILFVDVYKSIKQKWFILVSRQIILVYINGSPNLKSLLFHYNHNCCSNTSKLQIT